jgi:CRP-like cAMP-binding protein
MNEKRENLLLSVLPREESERIAELCESVPLTARMTLCEPDTPVPYAYFPTSGVCSSLVHAQNGEAVEVGLIGPEGMAGISLALDGAVNPFEVIVQIPGTATRIPREPFMELVLDPGRPFCGALLKYANLYLTTVAQTAACNRLHRIEQRLARWLLEVQHRAQTTVLPITHEVLGLMVGAYRPSVSNALKALEDRGVIAVGRRQVTIVDIPALQSEACECYVAIRRRSEQTLEQIRAMAAA